MTGKSLYICYFSVNEPLVETQVVAYLRELRKAGHEIQLLTFEPNPLNGVEIDAIRTRLGDIEWHWLPYHRRPSAPATLYDVLNGARLVAKLLRQHRFDILHCRIHVPAAIAALARRLSGVKAKILFDIRGFFPEEYTDAGVWPQDGWLYKSVKRVEKSLMHQADGFVVLTERARTILFPESVTTGTDKLGRPVEVIPCCVDMSRFDAVPESERNRSRADLGIGERFVITYVGSFGGWYLTDEMFAFFKAAREVNPDVFCIILTQRDIDKAVERLEAAGFSSNDYLVTSLPPSEVPFHLAAADAGLSFIKNCYSKQASSPTKNAEYLASGLPLIANTGVGDVDELIETDNVGVLVREFTDGAYRSAFEHVRKIGGIRDQCRETARKRFDLAVVGGVRYRRLYEKLLDRS